MRFGLTARVVTTVVALAVGVVAVDALVTRWAFQARFLSYVSEQERDSLERLAETMAAFHDEEGSLRGCRSHKPCFECCVRLLLQRAGSDRAACAHTGTTAPPTVRTNASGRKARACARR